MKKHLLSISMVAIMATCSCIHICVADTVSGDGNITTTDRAMNDFTRLMVAVPADVQVHLSSAPRVVVKTDANLQELVETTVSGGTLDIKTPKNKSPRFTKITVDVYMQKLQAIEVAGSGDVNVPDKLQGEALKIAIGGAGNVKLSELTVDKFDASVSGSGNVQASTLHSAQTNASIAGSGNVTIAGKGKQLNIKITGSGDFNSENFEAKTVDVSITGSGDAKVWATEDLNVRITGSGDVRYRGDHPNVKSKIMGSGSVKR
jgi:hypothetical protein